MQHSSTDSHGGALLQVRDLRVVFARERESVAAVDGVTLTVGSGETLGLVGESGSGKTTLALSILGLVPPPGRILSGEILFEGQNLLTETERGLRRFRGGRIGMVFQEPAFAVDPLARISNQMTEALRAHRAVSRPDAREKCRRLLLEMGIGEPDRCLDSYPHQLSGGMLQRVLIAGALSCEPSLIIGDEPTSSLDVTVQAQILDLLRRLRHRRRLSMLLISHDLGVVAQLADRVAVMYAGQIVETAPVERLFAEPSHPYTRRLVALAPGGDATSRWSEYGKASDAVVGARQGGGCRYRKACPEAVAECEASVPELVPLGDGRQVRCHLRAAPPGNGSNGDKS